MTATVGLVMALVLIGLLILGVPICISIAISSIAAGAIALDFDMMLQTGAQRTFTGISVFTLIAIPFFILAGNIMNQGGIALRLMNLARLCVGKLPGCYAHTNAMANMMFGAISGSGVAAASAMGTIIGPIAVKEGYDNRLYDHYQHRYRSYRSVDSAVKRTYHLCSRIWWYFRRCLILSRLCSGYFMGLMLHGLRWYLS